MISPKYHHISQKKINRDRISYLAKDLQRSKMAVENITKFSVVQGKYKQQIQNVQQELQSCMMSIAVQSKKQRVLIQLVSMLKGQMLNYQETKKKEEEAEQMKKDKMIGKYQYEVDQILQKHNQQIAKIHSLKDMANSSRSERVVYSSLFKKLEKEIKYYEQIYKESLMFTQFTKTNPLKNILSQGRSLNAAGHKQLGSQQQKSRINDEIPKLKTKISIRPELESGWKGFITSKQESGKQAIHKKFYSTAQQEQISKISYHKQEKFAYTHQVLRQISQYSNLIDKLKMHTQCSTSEEIMQYYTQIQLQNKEMLATIFEYDAKIEQVERITHEISKKAYDEQVALRMIMQDEANQMQNQSIYNKSLIQSSVQEENQAFNHKFDKICAILNIQPQINGHNCVSQSSIRLLDQMIENLWQNSSNKGYIDREQTTHSETVVQGLLQKMEKFNNCQKILDRGLLQQEYYKELSKKKQLRIRKQPSRC